MGGIMYGLCRINPMYGTEESKRIGRQAEENWRKACRETIAPTVAAAAAISTGPVGVLIAAASAKQSASIIYPEEKDKQ